MSSWQQLFGLDKLFDAFRGTSGISSAFQDLSHKSFQ